MEYNSYFKMEYNLKWRTIYNGILFKMDYNYFKKWNTFILQWNYITMDNNNKLDNNFIITKISKSFYDKS